MPDYEYEPLVEQRAEQDLAVPSGAALELATAVARQLIDEGRSVQQLEQEYRVILPLVEDAVLRFNMQLQVADDLRMLVPCLSRPDAPIPIDWLPANRATVYGWTKSRVLAATKRFRSNYEIVDASPDEARNSFRRWLTGFIGASVGHSGQAGLLIRVVTRTPGLRVHYSTTLLFNPNQVFGTTLSTPVDGYLPPGTYMFGVQGAADPAPRFDNGIFAIPPTTQANLVIA